MKAWHFHYTHKPLERAEIPEPTPGPGEVVLDIKAAGLCHSDVGVLDKEDWLAIIPNRPIVMGHEIAGVVSAVGEGVTEVAVGDRVGVCPTGASPTNPGYGRDGGFTEKHVCLPGDLVKMPDGLSYELAALGTDAGMTSYHAIMTIGGLQPGWKVGVIGFGGLGQVGARVGVVKGAEVHVAEVNRDLWDRVREIGVADVVADAAEWAGQGFDLIVDYAGFGETTTNAAKAVRRGGTVVLVGMGKLEFTLHTMDMILGEVRVLGSNGGTPQDIADVYELLASGEIEPTVTVVGFDDIPAYLDKLRAHEVTGRVVAHIAD
ncbi:zinc-binding dehydrogenase [Actinotalea fermentans]|uniref:alcohol dehydrogenase n=1 Tax=Actinotalea fermentans TaxID=43671 RepID=A0A511YZA1_9CELL|nr:zinc-binding dehydrogenase [Actinotalea fermentans]KGM15140.1 alcohol dehydrogenase [Actinotalea fermentans ATCC 43279 = JCM 9966 = DSM 3133]GEN80466.1 zinc-dependent alcohol dehydrogenase [Actinotalea fermentans]